MLGVIAVFHVLTMPKFYYPGDNYVIRAECAHLLNTRTLGIPYEHKDQFRGFLAERGQYFFENDQAGKLFSKYGLGYTILYIPPLLAEKIYSGDIPLMTQSESQLVFLNIYYTLLTLVAAFYLYALAGFHSERVWIRIAFVGVSFYATFLWHYLRSPTTEIFHIVLFVAFCFHALAFIRADLITGGKPGKAWRHLGAAASLAAVLVLIKHSFALLWVALWLFAFVAPPPHMPLIRRPFVNLGRRWRPYLVWLVTPSVVGMGLFFGFNYWRTGSILESGYGQWISPATGLPAVDMGLRHFPGAFSGFVLRPGNTNIFLHYPLLVLGLVGFFPFARRHPAEAAFIGFVALSQFAAVCFLACWNGEWCYGPRLLIHSLVIGALPAVCAVEWLSQRKRAVQGIVTAALFVPIFAWSIYMQFAVNSLHYFTWHYLGSFFDSVVKSVSEQIVAATPEASSGQVKEFLQGKSKEIPEYLGHAFHRGFIHADLIRYRDSGASFAPLRTLEEMAPPQHRGWTQQLRPQLLHFARSNCGTGRSSTY